MNIKKGDEFIICEKRYKVVSAFEDRAVFVPYPNTDNSNDNAHKPLIIERFKELFKK